MKHEGNEGFVLPYVLVFLLILSLLTITTVNRLIKSTSIVSDLQFNSKNELLLHSAETEAVFSLLTGSPVPGGLDINPLSPIPSTFGLSSDALNLSLGLETTITYDSSNIWDANGALRQAVFSDGLVFVELHDVSGLVSLRLYQDEDLINILEHLSISKEVSRSLVAKLRDYSDSDQVRRFRGAEDFDYKAQGLQLPTHQNLRAFQEIYSVMDWHAHLQQAEFEQFMDLTTLQIVPGFKTAFIRPEFFDLFSTESSRPSGGISGVVGSTTNPSGRYRLTFYIENNRGGYMKRVLEISVNALTGSVPFKKRWVYENRDIQWLSVDDLQNTDYEIKDVLHASPIRAQ